MKNKLFGNDTYTTCAYCSRVKKSEDGMILYCGRKGIVRAEDTCRRFSYDPFKRVPRSAPKLPEYEPEEFIL